MNKGTLETITRHLKGIVAALDKEKQIHSDSLSKRLIEAGFNPRQLTDKDCKELDNKY